jgi:two-component system nitrate/nitrite response regulator NarL
MRATRVIYVENDPALREILASLLSKEEGIEVVASVGSATEALQLPMLKQVDAALIDYSLGSDSLNGLELGIALRAFNENLGILIYSQFDIKNFSKRIPSSMNHGWGFATKSGNANISELAQTLISVAQGKNLTTQLGDTKNLADNDRIKRYGKLSERQRATMKLAAQGFTPKAIGEKLGMSYDVARQELSRTYKILVPNTDDEKVLSVTAILEFNAIRAELENLDETST